MASANCSKILNDKKYVVNTVKFQEKLCFSGQVQVVQKCWTMKNFSMPCIQCIFTWRWSV